MIKSLLSAIKERDEQSVLSRLFHVKNSAIVLYEWNFSTQQEYEYDITENFVITIEDMQFVQETLNTHIADDYRTLYGHVRFALYRYILHMQHHMHGQISKETLQTWTDHMVDPQFWMAFADSNAKENYGTLFQQLSHQEKKVLLQWYVTLFSITYNDMPYALTWLDNERDRKTLYEHRVYHIMASGMDENVLNTYDSQGYEGMYDNGYNSGDDSDMYDDEVSNIPISLPEYYCHWLYAQKNYPGFHYEACVSSMDQLWLELLIQVPWEEMTLSQWTSVLYPDSPMTEECNIGILL